MHPSLRSLDHRPWPLPAGAWKWRQSWLDLAFLHYRVSAEEIGKLLPPGVELQEFDGSAWVGLVPFRMAGVMRRPFPSFPPFNSFPELNLRTYVEVEIEECGVLSAAGISTIDSSPVCHFSGGVAVVSYAKEVVG